MTGFVVQGHIQYVMWYVFDALKYYKRKWRLGLSSSKMKKEKLKTDNLIIYSGK